MTITFDDIDIEAPIDNWIKTFFSKLSFHIDISDNFPIALDEEGEEILINSKFWILFIRVKIADSAMNNKHKIFLELIEKVCQVNQDRLDLLYDYFVLMVRLFFKGQKIKEYINKKKGKDSQSLIFKDDYSYILKNGDIFRKNMLIKRRMFFSKGPLNLDVNELIEEEERKTKLYGSYVNFNVKNYDNEECNCFSILGNKQARNTIDKVCDNVCLISSSVVNLRNKK